MGEFMDVYELTDIKEWVGEDDLKFYQSIIDMNCNAYSLYIASGMSYSFKKTRGLFIKDRIGINLNSIIYKINTLLNKERINKDFEKMFLDIKLFSINFQAFLQEFKSILNNEELNPALVPDLYLYYIKMLAIYNNVFCCFDDELNYEHLLARGIRTSMTTNKTLEETFMAWESVQKRIRELK